MCLFKAKAFNTGNFKKMVIVQSALQYTNNKFLYTGCINYVQHNHKASILYNENRDIAWYLPVYSIS